MKHSSRRLSLRFKLTAVVGLLLSLMALILGTYVPVRMNDVARLWAERRAAGIARVLAAATRAPYDLADLTGPSDLQQELTLLADAPGATYGTVLREDKSTLTTWNPNTVTIPTLTVEPTDKPAMYAEAGVLHVQALIETASGARGYLQIGFSMAELETERQENTITIATIMLVVFAAGLLLLSLLIGKVLIDPITKLTRLTAEVVGSGDLTVTVDVGSNDEIGELATSFSKTMEWQRSTLRALRRLASALAEATGQVSSAGVAVGEGTTQIGVRVEETSSSMNEMLTSIKQMEDDVGTLHESAVHGSNTIRGMASTNETVASNMRSMADFVDETTTAIEAMALSVRDVAGNIENVSAAIHDTSSSMNQLDETVSRVAQSAQKTSELSQLASTNADKGNEALQETLGGIEMIRNAFSSASEAIDQLVKRVVDVTNGLERIDEIADQTELLALNAAIISAQAGEQGRAFAVVAEEIRALADRTKNSTREISDLITNVERDSQRAIAAMAKGTASVQTGIGLGQQAEKALSGIQQSAREATSKVQEIAQATVEQAAGNNQVTSTVNRIADTITQINAASGEQAQGAERIIASAAKMKQINQTVYSSSQKQATSSSEVNASIDNITAMVESVNNRQGRQTEMASEVLAAIHAIQAVTEQQGRAATYLENVIASLEKHAAELDEQLSGFKTD